MSENQFLTFMRSLTDFRDHEIIEIFDIFDYDYVGGIAFDEVRRREERGGEGGGGEGKGLGGGNIIYLLVSKLSWVSLY